MRHCDPRRPTHEPPDGRYRRQQADEYQPARPFRPAVAALSHWELRSSVGGSPSTSIPAALRCAMRPKGGRRYGERATLAIVDSLSQLEVLVIDCQATAAAPLGHLLEIGWARATTTVTAETRARLIALPSGVRIPPAVARITGISERMAQDGANAGD